MLDLQILPGRVLQSSIRSVTVEFPSSDIPPLYSTLTNAEGTLCEVLEKTTHTEVRAVLRNGPLPPTSSILKPSPPLALPSPTPQHSHPATHTSPTQTPPYAPLSPTQRPPLNQPPNLLHTGHIGVDALSPLGLNARLALTTDDLPTLTTTLLQAFTPNAPTSLFPSLQSHTHHPILVSHTPLPFPKDTTLRTLSSTHNAPPGNRALLLQTTLNLIASLPPNTHPILVLHDLPRILADWFLTDAPRPGIAAAPYAFQHLRNVLDALHTLPQQPSIIALLWDPKTHDAPILPGLDYEDILGLFDSCAHFNSTTLLPRDSTTTLLSPSSTPQHSALIRSIQDLLFAPLDIEDFATIFGDDELTESHNDLLSITRQLHTTLNTTQNTPIPQTLETLTQLILSNA